LGLDLNLLLLIMLEMLQMWLLEILLEMFRSLVVVKKIVEIFGC